MSAFPLGSQCSIIFLFSHQIIHEIIRFSSLQVSAKHQYEEKFIQKLNAKCAANDNSSCVMAKLLNYMNKMIKKPSFFIGKRITLQQTRSVWLFRSYP